MVINFVLILTAVIGGFTDARNGKIYNVLTFPVMVMGLGLNLGLGQLQGSALRGLETAAGGILAGIAIQFVPFWLGLIKGGDVKFLAAAGALKGPVFVFWGFLYGAALFGVYAIILLAAQGKLAQSLTNIREYLKTWMVLRMETDPAKPASQAYMPWGVSLAAGFLLSLLLEVTIGTPYYLLQ